MVGVKSVVVNRKESRVTVSGYVDPNKVLKRIRRTGKKRAEFWPYVPQHLVHFPYVSGVYDKRAPAGYVRNVTVMQPSAVAANTAATHSAPNRGLSWVAAEAKTSVRPVMSGRMTMPAYLSSNRS